MPAGRPLSEDAVYAKELGVSRKTVTRLGGAKYLKKLPEENRNLLLRYRVGPVKKWGLAARGLRVCRPHEVNQRAAFEATCEEMLRERWLIPPHVSTDLPLEALLADLDVLSTD